jgi:hypothetical protein
MHTPHDTITRYIADIRIERQRRSLVQPKAGDNIACLGKSDNNHTTPTGLPIAHVAPASKAPPLGLRPVFGLLTRGSDVVATTGLISKRHCRFNSRDSHKYHDCPIAA